MIKFENTEVFNFEGAIRGMRMPMQSYDKIDSYMNEKNDHIEEYIIGNNDMALMKKLVHAGTEHSKFMRQIFVNVDITAPRYWFLQYDTYKVGTTCNSTSTMHTLHKKAFTKDMFSWEMCSDEYIEYMLNQLNGIRECYLDTKNKQHWLQLIQMLPQSFNQTRTCTLNYAVLRTMYHQRKDHKLDEWAIGFVEWVKSLPYSELITK